MLVLFTFTVSLTILHNTELTGMVSSTHFCEDLDWFPVLRRGFGPFYYIGFSAFMTSCPVSMQSLCKSSLSDRTVTSGCQVLEENLLFCEYSSVSVKDISYGHYCRVFL